MNKNYIVIIVGIAAFVIGLLIGTGSSGDSKMKEADVKILLTQAMSGIEKLEENNRSLKGRLEDVKKGKVARENASMKKRIEKMTAEKLALNEQISLLKGQVEESAQKLEAQNDQSSRIAELEKLNKETGALLKKISTLTRGEEIPIGGMLEHPVAPEK